MAALLAFLGACSSTGPSGGTLIVNIDAPDGTTPSVTVTGPRGYTKTFGKSTLLSNVPAGSYTISGTPIVIPDPVVGVDTSIVVATINPVTVTANQEALTVVTYRPTATANGLWVLNENDAGAKFALYSADALQSSGSPSPAFTLAGVGSPFFLGAVALDRQGNLWSVDWSNNTLYEYTAAQFGDVNAQPTVAIAINGAQGLTGLAFDSSGDAWIVDRFACAFYEVSAATIAATTGATSRAPDVAINTGCTGPTLDPIGVAFDSHGNMWITDDANFNIYEYPADSLKVGFSGLYTQRNIIRGGSNGYPAFDASGNLWVTEGNGAAANDSVFEFTAAQLTDASANTPTVAVAIGSAQQLQGLAFDISGALWLADNQGSAIYKLAPAQLASGGTVTPNLTLTEPGMPWSLAFSPHASGLPLFAHIAPKPTARRVHLR